MSFDLNILWFILLGVLLAGYAVLDGFDLGVGMLHWIARDDRQRRIILNSIGPIWDGNEVWFITFGGAMFAAFPWIYAAIFEGFYTALMIVLLCLISRAVSLEFRSKLASPLWRKIWDSAFFLSSFIVTIIFGVAVGNVILGLPMDQQGQYTGSFLGLLTPYPIVVGLMTAALFAMHGSIYLYLKTEDDLQSRVHNYIWHTFGLFMVMYMFTTIFTLAAVPHATVNFQKYPAAWFLVLVNVLAIANIPRAIFLRKPGLAFISSSVTIITFVGLLGLTLFPNLIIAQPSPDHALPLHLDIYNSASSHTTLFIMTIIALVGMPCVLAYTSIIYWTFRGKVQLNDHSY